VRPTHPANRLRPSLLSTLPTTVALPTYDHAQLKTGIVHLGVGAFHRGHQAWYTEAVLNAKGGAWGILGVSLRSDQVQQQLRPQSGLYTLVQRHGASVTRQIIGAIQDVLSVPADNDLIIEAIAATDTHIVSLTITEKAIATTRLTIAWLKTTQTLSLTYSN
jgi:fructuronate reductase